MRAVRKKARYQKASGLFPLFVLPLLAASSARVASGQEAHPVPPISVTPEPIPNELLRVTEGGLTSAQVGERAAATSYNARAQGEALKSAAARVDEAWAAFLPRLSGVASYTRLSTLTPPSFGNILPASSSNNIQLPAVCQGNSLMAMECQQIVGAVTKGIGEQFASVSFPVFFNNWLLQATLTVPISDYFLRINQSYTAATESRDAARFDEVAARATSAADGRVAFYTWLGSRASVIVAVQALNDQKSHLVLARNLFDAGQASKSDVLRAGTNVTNAELQVVHAKNLADLAEKQMRVAMHARDEEALLPGESLEVNPPPLTGNVRALIDEALSSRMEIRSIDANAEAAKQQAKAGFAGELPVVSGFGDLVYADPNPRLVPPLQEWFPSWDAGVRITWSPNDTLVGSSNVSDLKARARQLEAQRGTLRDNIEIEVTQDYQNVRESDVNLLSAKTELESAEEAYRVTKELFNNGRATSTTLTDSETELTRARLDLLTAQVNARTARVRLEHALGRDVRVAQAGTNTAAISRSHGPTGVTP
jgi:outer membrane protein TolC